MRNVSLSTVQRRRRELGIDNYLSSFSGIFDDQLDQIYQALTGNNESGNITPNLGRRRFIGALRRRG